MQSGKIGKFGIDDKFAELLNEVITPKVIAVITESSLRSAYRYRSEALVNLQKPPKYKLTLGQFCSTYEQEDPERLIMRYLEMRKGK